jgi:LPS-assembly lipoprotein
MNVRLLSRAALCCCLGIALAACGGWHLRGSQVKALGIERVNLRAIGAPMIEARVRELLGYGDVTIVGGATPADATIALSNESFATRVLSIDPQTGKVREVELGLQLSYELLDAAGQVAVPMQTQQWIREYAYDESSVLGTVEQESVLRQNLVEDAAALILLRMQTLRPVVRQAPAAAPGG